MAQTSQSQGKVFYCQAKQAISESEQLLSRPLSLLPSSPHLQMRHFQYNSVHMASLKKPRSPAKHSSINLCMSYCSKGTRIASKWDTPAQLEPGRQGWLLTFQSICTGRGHSMRKGSFTLVQSLHYSSQKLMTGFNK